jgi:hypothetical protein
MKLEASNPWVVLTQKDSSAQTHTWTYDPHRGYALISYTLIDRDDNAPWLEFTSSDFTTIAGIVVPKTITERRRFKDGNIWRTSQTTEMQLVSEKIGDVQNTLAAYHIRFPHGASILDTRTEFRLRLSEDEVLDDAKLNDEMQKADKRKADLLRQVQDRLNQINTGGPTSKP